MKEKRWGMKEHLQWGYERSTLIQGLVFYFQPRDTPTIYAERLIDNELYDQLIQLLILVGYSKMNWMINYSKHLHW